MAPGASLLGTSRGRSGAAHGLGRGRRQLHRHPRPRGAASTFGLPCEHLPIGLSSGSLFHSLSTTFLPSGSLFNSLPNAFFPSPSPVQHLRFRHVRFFGRPPTASNPAPKPPTPADLDLTKHTPAVPWPSPPTALHMLVSCDSRGMACISAYGQLQVAVVDLRVGQPAGGQTTEDVAAQVGPVAPHV